MPRKLLRDLARRRIEVTVDGHELVVRAPNGVLTVADRAALHSQKPAILQLLRSPWSAADAEAVIDAWPNAADRVELRALYAEAVNDYLKHARLTLTEAEQQAFIVLICELLQRVASDDETARRVASATAR